MERGIKDNLVLRTLTGMVLLGVVMAATLVSQYTFGLLLLVICGGSLYEFYVMAEKCGTEPQKRYGLASAITLITLAFFYANGTLSNAVFARVFICFLLLMTFCIFINELYRKKKEPITNVGVTLAGIMYIAVPLALLIYISMPEREYNPWVLLSYIVIVWANDIGAFLFGITFGRHKLFERISPKKTWEGFVGGAVTAIAVGLLCGWLLRESLVYWTGLAAVVVAGSVFGDLVESLFKRSAAIKDSGNVMPGHGGFLDRFDALVFSVPFVLVYFIIFTA